VTPGIRYISHSCFSFDLIGFFSRISGHAGGAHVFRGDVARATSFNENAACSLYRTRRVCLFGGNPNFRGLDTI